jgi:hypothetical protein
MLVVLKMCPWRNRGVKLELLLYFSVVCCGLVCMTPVLLAEMGNNWTE